MDSLLKYRPWRNWHSWRFHLVKSYCFRNRVVGLQCNDTFTNVRPRISWSMTLFSCLLQMSRMYPSVKRQYKYSYITTWTSHRRSCSLSPVQLHFQRKNYTVQYLRQAVRSVRILIQVSLGGATSPMPFIHAHAHVVFGVAFLAEGWTLWSGDWDINHLLLHFLSDLNLRRRGVSERLRKIESPLDFE